MVPPVVVPKEYTAQVSGQTNLSPKVLLLQLTSSRPISYTAGQYASFLIGNMRRPFSFASASGDTTIDFVIDVSPDGIGSSYVKQLTIGELVRFLAPYGRFTVSQDTTPIFFVATGAGIAPIRAQIQQVLQNQDGRPMTLLLGNRDEHHSLFQDEFTALAKRHAQLTFIPTLSQPSPAWTGTHGRVTEFIAQVAESLTRYEFYVCGAPQMVKDVTALLVSHAVPTAQIHSEQFV